MRSREGRHSPEGREQGGNSEGRGPGLRLLLLLFKYLGGGGGEKRETWMCCSTHLFIHWLIPACALAVVEPATLVYSDHT